MLVEFRMIFTSQEQLKLSKLSAVVVLDYCTMIFSTLEGFPFILMNHKKGIMKETVIKLSEIFSKSFFQLCTLPVHIFSTFLSIYPNNLCYINICISKKIRNYRKCDQTLLKYFQEYWERVRHIGDSNKFFQFQPQQLVPRGQTRPHLQVVPVTTS